MRSVGVTPRMLAITPALMPASMLFRGDRAPVSGSLKAFFMESKEKKRTESFASEP